jgi:hypothetical protein
MLLLLLQDSINLEGFSYLSLLLLLPYQLLAIHLVLAVSTINFHAFVRFYWGTVVLNNLHRIAYTYFLGLCRYRTRNFFLWTRVFLSLAVLWYQV